MRQYPLLHTKLYIPSVQSGLVNRPRLIEQLNANMDSKLALISAPAGYSKTTLLSEWIHQDRSSVKPALPVAWLSLDEADNDPTRFLTYLIGAAQKIVPHAGGNLLSTLQSPQPPPLETVLTSLINELTASPQDCDQCCLLGLVLDDYHLIENQEIHDAMAFLLDHLPPPPKGMHLVIATRKDPLLPLSRWRVRAVALKAFFPPVNCEVLAVTQFHLSGTNVQTELCAKRIESYCLLFSSSCSSRASLSTT